MSLKKPSARSEAIAVAIGAVALTLVCCRSLLPHLGETPVTQDWDQFMQWYWAAWDTATRFHQLPLWNPYECGGTPLLGNPQSRFLTPWFLLHLAAGPTWGIELEILGHVALAISGGYVLARAVGLSPGASIAGALVFPASSALYLHVSVGHGWSLSYGYLPWVVAAAWYAATRRRLWAAGVAGLIAGLMIDEGGIYPAPHALLLTAVLLTLLAIRERDLWPLACLAVVGGFTLLFAAPKLFPVHDLMREHPRLVDSPELVRARTLFQALFGLDQDLHRTLTDGSMFLWGYHEYGAYLGPAFAVLALVGIAGAWRRTWPWALTAAVFLALGLGNFISVHRVQVSPWALLHRLPLFASQHAPSRFLIVFVLAMGVLAGYGLQALTDGRWGQRAVVAGYALLAVGALDSLYRGPPNLRHMFDQRAGVLERSPDFHQSRDRTPEGHERGMYERAVANEGALDCYDYCHVDTHADGPGDPGYRGEQFVEGGGGQVSLVAWSPNQLAYRVEMTEPGILVINQNFDPRWEVTRGQGQVLNRGGRIGVQLAAGSHELTVSYGSRGFWVGVGLAGLGLVLLVGLALWGRGGLRGFATSGYEAAPGRRAAA